MFNFGKQRNCKDTVRDLCRKMNRESRVIDRQITAIQREEAKVKQAIKDAAAKGHKDVCKILAKEIVQSRKAVTRMYQTKAHINSMTLYMKNQLSASTMVDTVQRSTDAVKSMNYLVNLSECSKTMRDLSREIMKAGIIEEMVEETIDSVSPEVEEDELQEEIEKVMNELTIGSMTRAPAAVTQTIGASSVVEPATVESEKEVTAQMSAELEAMRARLAALRS